MIKKLLIIIMIMTLSSIQLFDVQANTSVLSQLPEAIQERLYDRLNNQEDDTITETKLTPSDGATNDSFGRAVAIDGSTLVVGAYQDDDNGTDTGSVYVYDLTKATSDAGFERKVAASEGASNDYFGVSVALDGSTLVVGAYQDDDNGISSGSVYVYDLNLDGNVFTPGNPATDYASGFERKITASDGGQNDYFGYAVAIDGSTLVVGGYNANNNGSDSGSVYVYDLTKATSDAGFERKVAASEGASNDYFGVSVALDGSTLVVGAYGDDDNVTDSGSVYVYDLTLEGNVVTPSNPATNYASGFERKITASDGAQTNYFGISVALDGSTLVVGSYFGDDDNVTDSGSVYVYDLTLEGNVVTPSNPATNYASGFERKITASDGARNDYFGVSVALDGSTLVVGARGDDDNESDSGSVYVYDLTKESGATGFERKITASDGTTNDSFGFSVAIDGSTLVVGAHYDDDNGSSSGSVYVYDGTFGSGTTKTDEEWASEITSMIDALTDPYVRADVEAARTAYDNLTEDQQALISAETYQTLLDAEQALADIDAAAAVDTLIDGLTSPYVRADVEAARTAYDNLTEDQQALVTGLLDLEASEQALADIDAAEAVDTLIDALTEPYVRADVEAARTAYDNLTEDQQALVTGLPDLEASEQALADIDAAAAVDAIIDALTEPYDPQFVQAAREAYENLTEEQQLLVTGLIDLELAEAELNDQLNAQAAAEVDALIDALTDPYDIEAIEAARDAYDNLTEDQQALVTGLLDLEEAEQRYEDIDAASIVDGMIAALSEPYDAVAVYDARLAYDALTETQKGYVTRLPELEAAELAVADQVSAAAVDTLIDGLTSPYDPQFVQAAREAYDNLTEDQQALISAETYQTLLDAEAVLAVIDLIDGFSDPVTQAEVDAARTAFDALTESQQDDVTNEQALLDAEQALADIDAAEAVDTLIDALTEPYVRADVEAARDAYDNLTEDQQALVTGLLDLEASEQALADIDAAAAEAVDTLIDALTEPYVRADVEAARDAYDNLTEDQQALISAATYQTLLDAEAVLAVIDLIDGFSDPVTQAEVDAARTAFDALTESQQDDVTNEQALLDAEQALADIDAAAAVDTLIDALTEPYVRADVEAARDAYDNLTEDQQDLVTGLLDLELAEDTLMNETEAADVDALIQTLTEDSTEEEVDAVRAAYENLTESQQALVTGLSTLVTYEQQFASTDYTGLVFFMIILIGAISAVIYFGFYKLNHETEKPNIKQNKGQSKENDQEHSKDNFVSKTFIEKELKGLRERLQKKYDYAEFFIYSDEQLQHLIKAQPKTKAEFLKVKGFGEKKYKNFGKDVIQIFKTYRIKD